MLKAEYYKAEDKNHLTNGEKELMLYQGGHFWRPEFWSREKGEWQKLKEKTSVFFFPKVYRLPTKFPFTCICILPWE